MTYKVEAQLNAGAQDKALDDLIAAYDLVDEVCTCGADSEKLVGFVEPHMLPIVTRIILRYAKHVNVSAYVDEEEMVAA
jgi:hypothetical protein